jgi:hypothetical protein
MIAIVRYGMILLKKELDWSVKLEMESKIQNNEWLISESFWKISEYCIIEEEKMYKQK